MSELLQLRGVSKSYTQGLRHLGVLRDVSLVVGRAEIVAVVGSRHEGKTTLLKVAAGLQRPDAGEVLFDGLDLASCPDSTRAGLLATHIAWADTSSRRTRSTVLDYLTLPLLMAGQRKRREANALAMAALERAGIASCASQSWIELSRWERMLVAVARAIVARPQLVILDDLLDGFGMLRSQQTEDLLASLVADLGCSLLLSTSDVESAIVADRLYGFDRGTVTALASEREDIAAVFEFPTGTDARRIRGASA